MTSIPLMRPTPPRLSAAIDRLCQIEDSGIFSNFGPVNQEFEEAILSKLFQGQGSCLTVSNATIGLMLAVKRAVGITKPSRKYALMPSFTFAATAHAAIWCGLTPLLCDIDPDTWCMSRQAEAQLLGKYKDEIAVVLPYATFGYNLDLDHYKELSKAYRIPVVIDAAASLGTLKEDGSGFGIGFDGVVAFSMHATKSFATGEAGLLYSSDKALISDLRMMCNFGFGQPRTATMPGLNGKLTELGALLALLRLEDYGQVMDHRAALVKLYKECLPQLDFQHQKSARQAHQFACVLLPRDLEGQRSSIQAGLTASGVGSGAYFSPHLAEQPYFVENAIAAPLPVTKSIANRIISLPLYDTMRANEVEKVAEALQQEIASHRMARRVRVSRQRRALEPLVRPEIVALNGALPDVGSPA